MRLSFLTTFLVCFLTCSLVACSGVGYRGVGDGGWNFPEIDMSDMNMTSLGATTGAVLGAGIGTVVGATSGNAGGGLVLGSLAGATAGGAVGYGLDESENKLRTQSAKLNEHQDVIDRQNQEIVELRSSLSSDSGSSRSVKKKNKSFDSVNVEHTARVLASPPRGNYAKDSRQLGDETIFERGDSSVTGFPPARKIAASSERSLDSAESQAELPSDFVNTTEKVDWIDKSLRSSAIGSSGKIGKRYDLSVASPYVERSVKGKANREEVASFVADKRSGLDFVGTKKVNRRPISDTRQAIVDDSFRSASRTALKSSLNKSNSKQSNKLASSKNQVQEPSSSSSIRAESFIEPSEKKSSVKVVSVESKITGSNELGKANEDSSAELSLGGAVYSNDAPAGGLQKAEPASLDDEAKRVSDSNSASSSHVSSPLKDDAACLKANEEAKRASSSKSSADKLFYFRRALRVCPSEAKYHYEIAKVYSLIGRNEDAVYELRQALDLNPGMTDAKSELAKLGGSL